MNYLLVDKWIFKCCSCCWKLLVEGKKNKSRISYQKLVKDKRQNSTESNNVLEGICKENKRKKKRPWQIYVRKVRSIVFFLQYFSFFLEKFHVTNNLLIELELGVSIQVAPHTSAMSFSATLTFVWQMLAGKRLFMRLMAYMQWN